MELFYIEKVLNGELSHFTYFIKKYKHMAFSLAFRITHNREDAEEVVQDSFLKAFKSLNKFKQDSKFSTWFYRIVVNTSLSKIKTRPVSVDLESDSISDNLIESVASAYTNLGREDQRRMIDQALKRMEVEDCLILTLYYLNENSIEEVSEITGISIENVKMKIHRARKKMYFVLSKMTKSEIQPIV